MRHSQDGLSPRRLNTVKAYAREYQDWQRALQYLTHTPRSQRFDEPQGRAQGAGRPTERLAIKRATISKKCYMIEQTAREAGPFIYPFLLKGVTTGATFETLFAEGMACSRNTYYTKRRDFYKRLSEKMYKLGI